ncbi:hypothetical protein [Chryseobacterium caseinilyticum]|uniref:GNAT family N-acetyltransferase n=1 Tax=Chryseobacterium caseinilyticum TaxID=2771428 RepID=A0ABR8Z8T9_9FLAO|nr:hypothetical protein [Chryseobacterium caseinilyticum]MBD8081679.1 hypothetical protein [Chryseobacterium caseinilyticum]
MIRKLKYHEIDFEKYSQCIENSAQRKYSATKQFLDLTSGKKWEVLVYGDYEAMMPVPYVMKLGFKIVQNPRLCQQLGIYSKLDEKKINDSFFNFLSKKYIVRYYSFNDSNEFSFQLNFRKNYLILPDSYENVYSKFSPKRKRKLRTDPEVQKDMMIRKISFKDSELFIRNTLKGADKANDIAEYISLFEILYSNDCLFFEALYYQNEIINIIAVYTDENTAVLLGTFNHQDYIKLSGASILIDKVLKETVEHKIFDFEGGNLPNLDEFFRGFRPEMKPYFYISNNVKDLIRATIKKYLKI